MSSENVEAVRKLYRGWTRGDFAVGMELFDPEIEFASDFGVDRVTAKGLDGMRRVWSDHLRNWDPWHAGELQEVRDLGDRVLAISPIHARGRQSGVEVEMPSAAAIFRFRQGKIVRMLVTARLEDALEALGLRE